MAMESIITARLSITPEMAIRTINLEKVRSDFIAMRLAMKYSVFKFLQYDYLSKNAYKISI
jgi:hypothetical protein